MFIVTMLEQTQHCFRINPQVSLPFNVKLHYVSLLFDSPNHQTFYMPDALPVAQPTDDITVVAMSHFHYIQLYSFRTLILLV